MKPRVVAIVGPTAIGKSRLALKLAPLYRGEIVSIDSMQIYQGMDIGTAKPGSEERAMVPHHMIDIVTPDVNFSVAEFQKMARRAVEGILERDGLPFLVGGSGLYLRAVVDDINFPSRPENPLSLEIRQFSGNKKMREALYERLKEVDPVSAERIGTHNLRRILRALEVYEQTGVPFSHYQRDLREISPVYEMVAVGLTTDRRLLYELIDRRVERMVEAGLIEEVRRLREKHQLSCTARQALGYKEVIRYLDNEMTLDETIHKIKMNSHRFAKRQLTWFRKDPRIQWIYLSREELAGGMEEVAERVRAHIDRALEKGGN